MTGAADATDGTSSDRKGVVALVGECLRMLPTGERPVVTLLGPQGSGASDAHNTLMELYGRTEVPFAYLNFGSEQPLLPRFALGLTARQLERKLPRYRVSRFPLLGLGLLASDNEIALHSDRQHQQRQLKAQLRELEDSTAERYGDYLSRFLQVAEGALGLPAGAQPFIQEIVRGAARQGARIASGGLSSRSLSDSARWYGQHRLRRSSDPWDAVVDLNQWRRSGSEEDADRLDRTLFAAFLEDLRRASDRSFAPRSFLLLLDNCHTAHGQRFLELLVRERQENADAGLPCDPLTTVVSVNRWLPRWGPSSGEQWSWRVSEPDGASLGDWQARRPTGGSPDTWWYPLRLRDLTLNEVRSRLSAKPQRDPSLAPFVHRLTGGLPRAVRQVVDLLDDEVSRSSGTERDAWLRGLPEHTLRAAEETRSSEGTPLVEAALDPLLEKFTADERRTLMECAAALDLSIGCQVLSEDARADTRTTLFSSVRSALLLHPPGASPTSDAAAQGTTARDARAVPTLHPWVRRLLLWQLAQRPDDWDGAHDLLGDYFHGEGWSVQEMYHRLAANRIDEVTEHLTRRYQALDCRQWIREFNAISAAPNRHPRDQDHRALVSTLTPARSRTDHPVEGDIRALLVARWVWSDPLTDPEMRLTDTVGERFARLSEHPRGDNLYLFNEAERYRNWLHPQVRTVEG